MLKFEKPIHRNRFRQPICRAISARFESISGDNAGTGQAAAPVVRVHANAAPEKPSAWNWGGGASASAMTKDASKIVEKKAEPRRAVVKRGRDEVRRVLSQSLSEVFGSGSC